MILERKSIMINKKYTTKKLDKLTFIDLFSGIGGFRLAFEAYGARCVFSSELDERCQEVYEMNFGEQPYGDITEIDEVSIPEHQVLCAGFPCQSFSISGKQNGFSDTRGTLFFDIARIVKAKRPKIVFLENVKNFERHDGGRTLATVYKALSNLDYTVFHSVLNASHFGVPQKRERIFILAFHKDLHIANFEFPISHDPKTRLKDFCLPDSETDKYVIKRKDISLKTNFVLFPNSSGEYPQKPVRIGTVNKGGQGERIYHENGHAITLSAYGGGVGAKTGLYLINGRIRKLAPRECARLSGFPDSFRILDSDSASYKQFGNTVVVNVIESIIENLIGQNVIPIE